MNPPVKKVGLVLKHNDARVGGILSEIVPWLQARGIRIFMDSSSAKVYSCACTVLAPDELAASVDMVAVFGGDGTLLYAARLVGASSIPIVGVNLGALGFLTEIKLEDIWEAFESMIRGDYVLEDRMMLEVGVLRRGDIVNHFLALNDAVINKGAIARMIELEVMVSAQVVTVTRADGLIISTPTGSTAYSLSAGGPILYPTLEAFIITPICPHTLTNRPVVVPDDAVVEVRLRHGSDMMLTVDGLVGMSLQPDDVLKIGKANSSIRLVQPAGSTFFKLLREKLKWG
jgi:NAD+ kinase